MGTFNLTEVVNTTPIPVKEQSAGVKFNVGMFGKEINLTPDYPHDSTNPWWFNQNGNNPWNLRNKGFGSICCGRNNELFLVTRVSAGHGYGGGQLYWSVSYDEGETWSNPQAITLDSPTDASEDLRDVYLCYDDMTDLYYLIYTHQYNIKTSSSGQYSNYNYIWGELKVWYGYEPFGLNSTVMYDISPNYLNEHGTLSSPKQPFNRLTQTFSPLVRLGNCLFLPVYGTDYSSGVTNPNDEPKSTNPMHSSLLRIIPNSNSLNDPAVPVANSWKIIKKWDDEYDSGSNETALYFTYDSTADSTRFNMLSRKGDMGWLTYSDDCGQTWSQKAEIGFDIAGGPRVFYINGTYMLVAREQKLKDDTNYSEFASTFAVFSKDGVTWSNRTFINHTPTAYASIAVMKSGKMLMCVSKESNTGIQVIQTINSLPIVMTN